VSDTPIQLDDESRTAIIRAQVLVINSSLGNNILDTPRVSCQTVEGR